MSADPRRTGGAANRGWCDGVPMHEPPPDRDYLAAQVDLYLADCVVYDLKPTEATALKAVYHRTEREARVIRAEFARQAAAIPRDDWPDRGACELAL